MASLKHIFYRQPAPWGVGAGYDVETTDLYMDGARYTNPNSLVRPPAGGPVVTARLASGQILGLAQGGVYPARPPEA